MENKRYHPVFNLMLVALIILGLFIGKDIFIPFVLALLVWYLINSIRKQIEKIKIAGKMLPMAIQNWSAIVIFGGICWLIGMMLKANINNFEKVLPDYSAKFSKYMKIVGDRLNISSINEFTSEFDLSSYASDLLTSSLDFISALMIVVFYVLFLILEQRSFSKKIRKLFSTSKQKNNFTGIVKKIDSSVNAYIATKSILSLVVSLITYIILYIFEVDFPFLWAFLTFLLSFIPFIGAFIAVAFPVLIYLLQTEDIMAVSILLSILLGLQIVFGNILEPKIVGKSVNLSPLVVLISLTFWSAIWGVAGMFLCVPITVTLMIIFHHFPKTKGIAIMLSEEGEVAS